MGRALGVTSFKDEAEALAIANDTGYGTGAASGSVIAPAIGREIQAGRVWTSCTTLPGMPPLADKKSGIGP